jgi:uncharacterized iron-regulated membrane protein
MKNGFRQSMAWLHTWAGLLVGWMLFAIFISGTAAYYRSAITEWMQPERLIGQTRTADAGKSPQAVAAEHALARLAVVAPHASRWMVDLPDGRSAVGEIAWQMPGSARFHSESVAASGNVKVRATKGGDFFYEFHYRLHYVPPLIGSWIVSFCAMFMLIAIVSGVITHRRIFADFFTFRQGKGQRSWLDAHTASAVLALPYHTMVTYTGLVTLMTMLMPWGMLDRYPQKDGGVMTFYAEAYDFANPAPAVGKPATLVAIAPLLAQANQRFGEQTARRIWVDQPGDAGARIKITRGTGDRISISTESITFNGVTGQRLATYARDDVTGQTAGVMMGLHEATFAPPFVRAVYFISGLIGALMVATGLIMWAIKHRQKSEKNGRIGFGTRLVEHLNIAAIAGMPIAVAAYFWANRLLPVDVAMRQKLEINLFFAVWALTAIHPLLRKSRRAWLEQLFFGAALFVLLPALDRITVGTWVMPSFDLVCLGLGAILALCALFLLRRRSPRRKPAAAKTRAEPAPHTSNHTAHAHTPPQPEPSTRQAAVRHTLHKEPTQ